MKKITAAIAIITLLAVIFASCENVSYRDESGGSASEYSDPYEGATSLLPPPMEDSGESTPGRTCVIVSDDASVFYQSESAPTAISNALKERNVFLYDNYGITVQAKQSKYEDAVAEIRAANEAKTYYCDMLAFSQSNTVKLYLAGLLYDINGLQSLGFDINSALFDQRNAAALATNSTLYMIPDASALVYDELNVVFFDRDRLDPAQTDPETLVQQGLWTWDRFSEQARAASNTANGRYGFAAYYENTDFAYPMWMSAGEHIVKDTYKNSVSFGISTDRMVELTDGLVKHSDVSYVYPKHGADASKAFEEGNAAFIFNRFEYIYALRDGTQKGLNYGFLPMPKYSASQERYYCLAGSDARVLSLPATLDYASESELRRTYALLATTCGVGGKTLKKAYVSTILTSYLATNAETVMLETIADSASFDFIWAYAREIKGISSATLGAIVDRITYGSKVSSSVNRGMSSFRSYCQEHFK